jgi:hypothetical protein
MQAIEIATKLVAKKISSSTDIFLVDKYFNEMCFWAKESARELFYKSQSRKNLVNKIDDVGLFVDNYMNKVRYKMLQNAKNGKNSLFTKLCSSEKTMKWLIQRWINVFINITTNNNYKDYIDINMIGHEFNDESIGFIEDTLLKIIKEEDEEMDGKKR